MRYIIQAKTKSRSCKVSFILPWDVDLFATVQVRTITSNHNRSWNVLTSNIQERIPLGFKQPFKICERLRNQTSVYREVFGTRDEVPSPTGFWHFASHPVAQFEYWLPAWWFYLVYFACVIHRNRKDGKIHRERWCRKDANRKEDFEYADCLLI